MITCVCIGVIGPVRRNKGSAAVQMIVGGVVGSLVAAISLVVATALVCR